MLCLTQKTNYALIALGYLSERPGEVVSARDVAGAHELPQALLMNILKTLQKHAMLRSTRGVRGGYRLAIDLNRVSLHDLIRIVEGKVEPGCDHEDDPAGKSSRVSSQGPIQALHFKLMQFLRDVSLADLVLPGRRIDVPVEVLSTARLKMKTRSAGRKVMNQLVPVEN